MSLKNNTLIAAASAALGMVVTVGATPICDGMLNDVNVTAFGAAEVDATGRVLVLVAITDGAETVIRPVADTLGNVRLYVDGNAAVALAKRSSLASGLQVKFVKMDKTAAIGDPVVALKSKYKRFKAEALSSSKQSATVTGKKTAAEALGWDIAVGTPENAEYGDIVARLATITEWKNFNDAKVVALAASLVAAGIDPATVV